MKLSIEEYMLGTIPLLEVVPLENKNELMPLIIFYHGWQSSKELTLTQGRYLAREGFRVILPDAHNHGARKQPVSKIPSLTFWQSINGNLFEFGYIVYELQNRGLADHRIGVGGVSMGGITTSALLTHHPEINAAACVMGSPKLVAYRDRISRHGNQLERFFPKDFEDLISWIPKYDLSLQPEKIAGRPVLFWHGIRDVIVPYEHTEEFVEENSDQENIQFISEDEEHLVRPQTMEKITQFFVDTILK